MHGKDIRAWTLARTGDNDRLLPYSLIGEIRRLIYLLRSALICSLHSSHCQSFNSLAPARRRCRVPESCYAAPRRLTLSEAWPNLRAGAGAGGLAGGGLALEADWRDGARIDGD